MILFLSFLESTSFHLLSNEVSISFSFRPWPNSSPRLTFSLFQCAPFPSFSSLLSQRSIRQESLQIGFGSIEHCSSLDRSGLQGLPEVDQVW